jgi:glyoxylase-like metal-dependent hydrolase (beta-lactamase superfamily II)
MRIHHLNCGSMCPVGGHLMDGFSRGLGSSLLSCHCLLIETEKDGLVLVDTGFGTRDIREPRPRLSAFFLASCRPSIHPQQTAYAQIKRLGYAPADVRHIVVTHLDFDHAGGIDDFPDATLHVHASEKEQALNRHTFIERGRFRPEQFRNHRLWRSYRPQGESWFGFEAVRQLSGLPPEILLIPLHGHTLGHCGVAVDTGRGWLLHAGDAYFYRGEMDPENPTCTPGLRAYQRMMDSDRSARVANQERLRKLKRAHSGEVSLFSAHDYQEYAALRDLTDIRAVQKAA